MIKELKISNFKSIKEQSFEFKPLVILTGTNSSGKSSILHAILLTVENKASNSLQELTKKFHKFSIVRNSFIKKDIISIAINGRSFSIDDEDYDRSKAAYLEGLKFEENLFFISANRTGAEDLSDYNDYEKFGIKGEYTFGYFDKHWQEKAGIIRFKDDESLKGQLWGWCKEIFELDFDVQTNKINENFVEIKYYFRNIDKELSPFNVGTGISYALRILIIGLNCKK
ncbi:MAG: AAA family ATPase, partial [Campylobacteraceae bacterium]|nr:AAA family ATPase [Campylobacteraceae bacterium]